MHNPAEQHSTEAPERGAVLLGLPLMLFWVADEAPLGGSGRDYISAGGLGVVGDLAAICLKPSRT